MKINSKFLAGDAGIGRSCISRTVIRGGLARFPLSMMEELKAAIRAFYLCVPRRLGNEFRRHLKCRASFPCAAVVICAGLLRVISASAAEFGPLDQLRGSWFVESATPQGMLVQVVTFMEQGQNIFGTWSSLPPWFIGKVGDVRVRRGVLSFTVTYDGNPPDLWRGEFHGGDRFSMTWIGHDGVPVRTRIFRRASKDALEEAESKAPKDLVIHKLPLPGIREVPDNGLARTPPMGWNSWNFFKERIDDKSVREIADALVQTGLRDAGYTIVTIDDGWQGKRDAAGILQANEKFPDMRALADYLHGKGLKFGIYSSPGPLSCASYIGSHGHETEDVNTFAGWGVDFLKYDWCSAGSVYKTPPEMQALFQKMGSALQASGRPVIYSISQYGMFDVGGWGRAVGANLWRTGGDTIEGDRWATMSGRFTSDGNPKENGPGGWNDPDMMLVGIDGLSMDEDRTHMTLWSMLAAPLIIGNDVRSMSAEVKEILLNREVLDVDQDPRGIQGTRLRKLGTSEIWMKSLSGGAVAIALFNRGQNPVTIHVTWRDLGLSGVQRVRDLWRKLELGVKRGGVSARVPGHGAVLLKAVTAP